MDATQRARELAGAQFKVVPGEVSATDISQMLPWVRRHAVVETAAGDRRMVVAIAADGEALQFASPRDLKPLNRLFEVEDIAFPDGIPAPMFGEAIRGFLAGFRGFVGSPEFWTKTESRLSRWLPEATAEARRTFESHCAAPTIEQHDDGQWTMRFFYFNGRGGVEDWDVVGDATSILAADHVEALPAGTFVFPYL